MPHKPVLSSPQEPAARFVIEKEANEKRCPLEFVEEPLLGYQIALAGEHQQWNAALAVAALHRAGIPLNTDIVRYGLAHLSWPGRFEEIQTGVFLDGAHNPHSAKVLSETWISRFPETKASLVFSAVADKDISGTLKILAPLASRIFLCPVNTPRAIPAEEIAKCLPACAPPHESFGNFADAFSAAMAHGRPILVAGSLFLIGEARAFLSGGQFQSSSQ